MEKFQNYQNNQESSKKIEDNLDIDKEINERDIVNLESQKELDQFKEEYEENREYRIEEKKQDIEKIYEESDLEKDKIELLDYKNTISESKSNIENENTSIDDLNNQLSSYQAYAYNLLVSKANLTSLYKEQEQNFFVKRYPFPHPEKTKLNRIMSEILENEKNIQDIQNKISELEEKLVSEILKKRDYDTEIQSLFDKINSDEFSENVLRLQEEIYNLEKSFVDSQVDLTIPFESIESKENYLKNQLKQSNIIREKKIELNQERSDYEMHNSLSYLNRDIFNYFEDIGILNQDFDSFNDISQLDDKFEGYFDFLNEKMNYVFETEKIREKFIKQLYGYYVSDIDNYSKYKFGTMVKHAISDRYTDKFVMVSNNISDYYQIKKFEKIKSEEELKNQELINEAEEIKIELLENAGKLTLSHEDFDKYFDKDSFEFGANLKQSNVGDCYLVAAMYSMSKSAQFEIMVRSSMKINPDGTWEVRIPLMSNNTETIKIYPNELKPQTNKNLGQDLSWNQGIKDNREHLMPLDSKQGFQILEAAYMKKKFGEVDRLKAEGGFSTEALGIFSQENIATSRIMLNEIGEFNKKKLNYIINNFNLNTDLICFNTHHSKGEDKKDGYKTYKVGNNIFYGSHAYSLDSIDKENKIIKVVNPWNTSKKIEIKFEDIGKVFDMMELGNIQLDKFVSNLQNI